MSQLASSSTIDPSSPSSSAKANHTMIGTKTKSKRGRPPKSAQKSNIVPSAPLHNVLEFKQSFSQLLRKEAELLESRPASLLDTGLLSISDLENTFNNDLEDDMEDEEMEDNQQHHHHDDTSHLMEVGAESLNEIFENAAQKKPQSKLPHPRNQTLRDLLLSKDLAIKTPEEIIEDAIRKELKRTKGMEDTIDMEVPNDVRKVLDVSRIPKLSTIIEEMGESNESERQQIVYSFNDEAKIENAAYLPKRVDNFIAPTEEANYFGKLYKTKNDRPASDEALLHVAIYHPVRNTKVKEFIVLGSQKLTELRDCIDCSTDAALLSHVSLYTNSGYFFIENTFYNDMRHENNIDYSENIITWLKSFDNLEGSNSNKINYSSRRMEDVCFYDLSIRLNEPYIYCHNGNCMHYIVFTEMRLINEKEDVMNIHAYPIRSFQAKPKRRKCGVCEIYQAKYITYKDKHTSDDPSFFCDSCYRQFHYDHTGHLLYGDYEVFEYRCD